MTKIFSRAIALFVAALLLCVIPAKAQSIKQTAEAPRMAQNRPPAQRCGCSVKRSVARRIERASC